MSLLDILEYPDPRLRIRAEPVTAFDAELGRLIDDMLETMYASRGIGLAATQVNVHRQVIVMDISSDAGAPQIFVNPIVTSRDMTAMVEESCLSVPGVVGNVARSAKLGVRYLDRHGAAQAVEADGLRAVCLQHEMDHLQGRLFVDRLSIFKRLQFRVAARVRLSS
jgi:peptide deformylase